jgi:spore maturation protein CgeD
VSVLLTTYNRPAYLRQAVESVFAQTCQDYELLILDDNSTDGLQAGYLASIWNVPKVRIIKDDVSPEDRPATTRYATMINLGLRLARGRHITYLCDDDWYAPRRLEVMSGMLDADPGLGVVYSRQGVTDEAGTVQWERCFEPVVADAYCRVDHSSVMHTAEAGRKAGGWDEGADHWRIGDAVFWRRLHAAGYSFHLAPGDGPLDFHRDHGAGVNKLGGPY